MLSLCQSPAETGRLLMYSELDFGKTWGLPEEGKGQRIKRKQGETAYETK